MFRILADEGINIQAISTSEIKVSCLDGHASTPSSRCARSTTASAWRRRAPEPPVSVAAALRAWLARPMQHPRARFAGAAAALAISGVAAAATAAVSNPHPGLTLVEQSGRALLVVDLCAQGVSVRATRYDERKKTAIGYGEALGLQAAINADFFDFPDATLVNGRARGDSQDWPPDKQHFEQRMYWQFGPTQASLVLDSAIEPAAPPLITNIVGGHNLIIDKGQNSVYAKPLLDGTHRRTAVGISEDRRTLYLLVSNNSISAQTIVSYMVDLAAEAGAPPIWYATNVDGGGSSQMYVAGLGQVISSTRLVANHIGIRATGSGAPVNCVPRYSGAFVAQSFPPSQDPPIELASGESVEGWFDLLNIGTASWSTATKLAPIPRDQPSPLADASWPAPHRAAHVLADTPPGAVGRFAVTLRGGEPGEHVQHFGLVEEGVTWFADATLGGGPPDDFITVRVDVAPRARLGGRLVGRRRRPERLRRRSGGRRRRAHRLRRRRRRAARGLLRLPRRGRRLPGRPAGLGALRRRRARALRAPPSPGRSATLNAVCRAEPARWIPSWFDHCAHDDPRRDDANTSLTTASRRAMWVRVRRGG